MKNKILLEGCIDNINDINYFIFKKINRLELCRSLSRGGLSPKIKIVKYVLNNNIDCVVMLREKNDFKLSLINLFLIKWKIKKYRKLGVKNYIFGFVKNNEIDITSCNKIISLLKDDEKYAFHMAIDTVDDYDKSINTLINLGFSWILTKGGNNKAIDNIEKLKYIIEKYDQKIKILVGGNVTKDNWEEIRDKTGATWFHGRMIK